MVAGGLNGEDFSALLDCPVFVNSTEADVRSFLDCSGVSVYCFSGGETVPVEVRSGRWSVVLSGSVRIYSGQDGVCDLLMNVVGAGGPFDIASLAGCVKSPVMSEVRSVGKSRIAFIEVMDTMRLMERFPEVAGGCMAFLCGRIGFLNRKIHTLSRGNAEQKLADYLLNEFVWDDGMPSVRIKSCVELAVRLNLSRASLYRAMGTLEQSGAIGRDGKRITINDVGALQNI